MTLPIKFAGLYLKWDVEYASSYKKKLEEMGFYAKIIEFEGNSIVAYSHRSFLRTEAISYLLKIIEEKH